MHKRFLLEFLRFCQFLSFYLKSKILAASSTFEAYKNNLVRLFTAKRGRYNRPFLHIALMGVLITGIVISPILAESFPIISGKNANALEIASPLTSQSIIVGGDVFQTEVSVKPRDKIITYTVERGDTISTIAKKFDISADTIKWANDLANDNITVGDELKILPVSGLSYKVQKGDSVYSIAKKFDTEPQKIVDFPFNDFANPETFALVEGQMLIVPDGVKPSEQPFIRRQVYLVQGPVSVSSLGFIWPVKGVISQFSSWYHTALDIATSNGAPVVAAQSGIISEVNAGSWNFGYGTDIWVDNGSGFATHYTHLSGLNVSVGESVEAGKTVLGWVGMTGRTTGPHLHFEIKRNGDLVDPLPYLQ